MTARSVDGAGLGRGLLWVSPWIVGFLLFLATPLGLSLYYSFTDYSLLESPVPIGLANYLELLGDELFYVTLRNTALYAVCSVTLGTVLAIAIAVLLSRPTFAVGFARSAVFLPTLVPLVAAALGWTWMFNAENGPINAAIALLGIRGPDWLGDARWAMWALIFMSLWHIGGATVIYLAALQDVPRSLYEAADLDGAGPLRRLLGVTLPMISPAIVFNVVVAIIWSLQVFAVPYIMTKGGPEHATYFYTMYLYDNAFVYGRMGYACAMGWLQLFAILLITGLFLRTSRRFVHYGGA